MAFCRPGSALALASLRTHQSATGAVPRFAGGVLHPSLFLVATRESAGAGTPMSDVGEVLSLPAFLNRHIHFAPSVSTLEDSKIRYINHAAFWLRAPPAARVLVVGFCDNTGSENCKHKLARKRAETVQWLLVKYGADPKQILAAKNWESASLCSAKTNQCQQQNRSARIFLASPQ